MKLKSPRPRQGQRLTFRPLPLYTHRFAGPVARQSTARRMARPDNPVTVIRVNLPSGQGFAEVQYRQLRQELIAIQHAEPDYLRSGQTFSEALIRQKEYEPDIGQVAIS